MEHPKVVAFSVVISINISLKFLELLTCLSPIPKLLYHTLWRCGLVFFILASSLGGSDT